MNTKIISVNKSKSITPILADYEFSRYRNYKALCDGQLARSSYDALKRQIKSKDAVLIVAKLGGHIIGMGVLEGLPWDSLHFKVKCARVDFLISDNKYCRNYKQRYNVKKIILESILQICAEKKIRFLSSKVDTQDMTSVHAYEDAGFKNMDTSLTYLYDARKPLPAVKMLFDVQAANAKELKNLSKIIDMNFFMNRFYNDDNINRKTVFSLYKKWVSDFRIINLTDEVLLARRSSGSIVGFITYELDKALYAASGVRLFGRGLSWVDSRAPGAYVCLLHCAFTRVREKCSADFAEVNVPIWNYPVIKLAQYFGMRLIVSHHSFHKWPSCDRQC